MFKSDKKYAFTLAEVLITLVIIGIIAAITVPFLNARYVEQQTVSELRKTYSTLSQAFIKAKMDNGYPDTWGGTAQFSAQGSLNVLNKLTPYLNTIKKCETQTNSDCYPNVTYKFLNGENFNNFSSGVTWYAKAVLSDGTLIAYESYNDDCSYSAGTTDDLKEVCGLMHVDINGHRKPNIIGKDLFVFYLTKNGFIPRGTSSDTFRPVSYCSKSVDGYGAGYGCTAWVLHRGNMDYLNKSVSWN